RDLRDLSLLWCACYLKPEAFVAQPADQALDEAVLHRLAGRDVVPGHAVGLLPGKDRVRGQLGAVVADDLQRPATQLGNPVELARDAATGERAVDHQGQALPAEIVDDDEDPEATPIRQDIGSEVEAPALVRPLRDRHRGAR